MVYGIFHPIGDLLSSSPHWNRIENGLDICQSVLDVGWHGLAAFHSVALSHHPTDNIDESPLVLQADCPRKISMRQPANCLRTTLSRYRSKVKKRPGVHHLELKVLTGFHWKVDLGKGTLAAKVQQYPTIACNLQYPACQLIAGFQRDHRTAGTFFMWSQYSFYDCGDVHGVHLFVFISQLYFLSSFFMQP